MRFLLLACFSQNDVNIIICIAVGESAQYPKNFNYLAHVQEIVLLSIFYKSNPIVLSGT